MTLGRSAPPHSRPEFVWDAARLRLSWANAAGVAFWGEDSLLDLTERVFAPGDATVRALAAREAEMVQGDAAGHVTLYPKGDPVWARVACTAERRGDGRTLMLVVLEQVEAVNDPALVRKRAGFDGAPRPLAIYDEGGALLVRNEADRRAYPQSGDDIGARYELEGEGARALARTLAEGAYSHTAMIRTATGSLRHRISLHRMRDPATARVCIIADFTDLSDRPNPALPNVDAQPAERAVSAVALARIAHDIRAPLGAISGFAEMLRVMGDALPPERQRGALEDITAACARLTSLTDRIIALGADSTPATLAMVDVGAACASVCRLFEGQANAAGMDLIAEVEQGLTVLADEAGLTRILDNLLRNALTHGARKGGRVLVRTGGGQRGQPVWLEVSDDGPGMPHDQIEARLVPYGAVAEVDINGGVDVGGGIDGGGGDDVGVDGQDTPGLGLGNVMAFAKDMAADAKVTTTAGAGFTVRVTFGI